MFPHFFEVYYTIKFQCLLKLRGMRMGN
uniref:Uncharacterized protein n=1 Tax=Anguilla anguilla TaxID=7936 RepID=A0A0E9QZG3_ANGAN